MTPAELRDATAKAVQESGKTQTQIASELNISQSVVSEAVNKPYTKLAGVQRRIIEHLTDFEIKEERTITYIARRKPPTHGT